MVIKKTWAFLIFLLWSLPMAFILPFLIIYTFSFTFLAIVPTSICFLLVVAGCYTLNGYIRFGTKLLLLDEKGVSLCVWRVKKYSGNKSLMFDWRQ